MAASILLIMLAAEPQQAAAAATLTLPPRSVSPYDINFGADGALTAALWTTLLITDYVVQPTLSAGPVCAGTPSQRCSAAGLNALDRSAVNNRSKRWSQVSDPLMYGTVGVSLAAAALDVWLSGSPNVWRDAGADMLMIAEAGGLAVLMTTILKYTIQRPRPTQYALDRNVNDFNQRLSFPSGHATAATAFATAFATTYGLRHPDSPWRWVVYGAAASASVLTGLSRTQQGVHFYTDVVAGTLIGGAVGFLVPYLRRSSKFSLSVGTGSGGDGASASATFNF